MEVGDGVGVGLGVHKRGGEEGEVKVMLLRASGARESPEPEMTRVVVAEERWPCVGEMEVMRDPKWKEREGGVV